MDPVLESLRRHPEFEPVIERIKQQRPALPEHDYIADNTEEWKALSNQRKGFNLVLTLLGEVEL